MAGLRPLDGSATIRPDRVDEEEDPMPGWRLREFNPDDLDGILRLWGRPTGMAASRCAPCRRCSPRARRTGTRRAPPTGRTPARCHPGGSAPQAQDAVQIVRIELA